MFKSILNKFNSTPQKFLQELHKKELNVNTLKIMLDNNKFSINYQDDEGQTFLHLCIKNNKFKSAKWLIQNNIDVTKKNYLNQEPIQLAIRKQNHLIVKLILKSQKININQIDEEGRSLLQNAVLSGDETIANELINNGIDINITDKNNRNVIFDAISYGDEKMITNLLETKRIDLNLVDMSGETILHKKEVLSNDELCIKLLKKGADATICDNDGKNLLYHSAIKGMEGSKLLAVALEQGCNINTSVKNNNTILMEALAVFYVLPDDEKDRRNSLLKMVENLVLKGINVNAINNDGENGLFDAVRNNDINVCAFLLSKKVNPNVLNNTSFTPLTLACMQGIKSLDIILLLLKFGSNPSIKNNNNQDILEILNIFILHTSKYKLCKDNSFLKYIIINGGYLRVLNELLKNSKYDLQNIDSKGQPLFFTPMLSGYYDLFKLYIVNKFDINSKNKSNLNIFYVYVNIVFSLNKEFDSFKSNILGMINYGIDINILDKDGKHIFSKIINNKTNVKLYEILLSISRFQYNLKDLQGRTVAHHAVLNKQIAILRLIYRQNNDVINLSDSYGILPITYAALLNNFIIVQELLKYSNVHIKSGRIIPKAVKEKFSNMVTNIDNIKNQTTNKDLLRKISILTDQIKKDFKL